MSALEYVLSIGHHLDITSGRDKAVITRSPGMAANLEQGNLMRIGLVGVGRIGVFHASTLRGLPGVDSLIITDVDPDRARQVAGEFGARTARSVTELLEAGVDALVIAAPTGTHPELIKRGVQAGVPVFCEKPVAPDVEGTLDVLKSTSG